MSPFEEAMAVAVKLPMAERERLAKALGLQIEAAVPAIPHQHKSTLPLATGGAQTPAAWREAERGHAVLATEKPDEPIAPGPAALRGIWAHLDLETGPMDDAPLLPNTLGKIPHGSPVVVHTSVVLALALNMETVRPFWENPPVEIRLATACYLQLLELCENEAEIRRVQAFVQPYAVLSLGPMASTKAAELMLEGHAGLAALDALIAATALAHDIPLVTRDALPFENIAGLEVATLP